MSEEEKKAIDILQNCIADYVIGEYCEKCGDRLVCNDRNEDCYFQQAIDTILNLIEKQEKEIQAYKYIENKLMPLAECYYWDYENHTCTHTCRGCDLLNPCNTRSESGILIDKDRYCRLYENGYAEDDTKFVDVNDLIKRHFYRKVEENE